ncbi:MAG: DNA polymerase [Desulfovibrionaceae bacterium]|nr:DNA polymerase [Desulfovibrionaceae bacterium]
MPLPKSFMPQDRPLFLMDGTAYLYRGYYANSTLQRSDGFPTGALTVVTRILLRILRQERPSRFVFVKDGHGKNFRHEIYPEYKANRSATPEALVSQMEPVRRMVEALGLHYEESSGCEADDCIASLAARYSVVCPVVIVSADKDLKQCLGPRVIMWDPGTKEEKLFTAEAVEAENGIPLSLWPDLQALTGDAVDNIPGVPGIGPKTALQILKEFPGLEAIRDRFQLLSPKHQKKLDGHLEEMFVWRRLTTLSTEQCGHLGLADLNVKPLDVNAALAVAREFELRAVMREIMALGRETAQGAGQREETGADIAPEPAAPAEKPRAKTAGKRARASEARDQESLGAAMGLSLLDVVRGGSTSSLATLKDEAELPDCADARLAVIWPEGDSGPCCCAVQKGGDPKEAREFIWAGAMARLAAWSAQARLLVVTDAKSLLGGASPWRETVAARIPAGGLHDLGLAAYLFNPEESGYSWQKIVGQASLPEDVDGRGPGCVALALESWGRAKLARDGLDRLYDGLELPLVPVLAGMEAEGVRVDMNAFQGFLGEVRQELSTLTQQIYEGADGEFNIRSSQQLADVLYRHLGLKSTRRTSGGLPSTSQEALESLAGHPVVDAILRYRRLEKMRSTYLEPLPRLTDGAGRLHTTFNQEATATGRLSSSNPNLQNIPVRGALGKRMRACFVAGEGRVLLSCDYSQIELRVLAGMSRDAALLAAFAADEDIHARTAALIYECEPAQVTPDQRRNAKTINFGLLYGMGAQKLARETGVKVTEAKAFIERYFASLTGVRDFYERVESDARRDGWVTTIGGRRRLLPNISSNNAQEQALARRQAVNTVIQGSAADIIKMAMLDVWNDAELRAQGARLVLQVHDELVVEVPEVHAAEAGARVALLMESVLPGGRPFEPRLRVDWGMGRDWGQAH